jgi:protein SCO1/2
MFGNLRKWSAPLLLIATAGAVSSCARPLPVFGEVPDFSLTDQAARLVTKQDLAGSLWVADFIYTGCGSACPLLTQRMAEIGRDLNAEAGRPVRLVSFTVDPEVDTPERLREYAERFGASPETWLFLTGPGEEIRRTVSEGFKLAFQKASDADVFHSEKLVVIDARGKIRGYYSADPAGAKELRAAVKRLRKEGGVSD